MGKKMTKGLVWSLSFFTLLFGLFFCIGNDKANSVTKNDKDKLTTARSLGQAFVEVSKKVQPAVVNITTEKTVAMRP